MAEELCKACGHPRRIHLADEKVKSTGIRNYNAICNECGCTHLFSAQVGKKVVRLAGGVRVSALAPAEASVTYHVGQMVFTPDWLAEKGYHLTGFWYGDANLHAVLGYERKGKEVWKAELWDIVAVVPPRLLNLHAILRTNENLDWGGQQIAKRWRSRLKVYEQLGNRAFSFEEWPRGTVMARGIKLLERLQRY
jgi:hypothetical protein